MVREGRISKASPRRIAAEIAVYLDLALIFLRFLFSLRIRFLRHLALISGGRVGSWKQGHTSKSRHLQTDVVQWNPSHQRSPRERIGLYPGIASPETGRHLIKILAGLSSHLISALSTAPESGSTGQPVFLSLLISVASSPNDGNGKRKFVSCARVTRKISSKTANRLQYFTDLF